MRKFLIFALSVVLVLTLSSCAKKNAVSVTAAKNSDGIENGNVLYAEDASALLAQITAAEKENDWIDAVSNSIPSCYFMMENAGEKTLYKYCDSGVLDDVTNMRSLTLSDACRDAMSEILSKYVDLKLQVAHLPELGNVDLDIALNP